jgi:DNA topoisomerase-3
MTFILAEKPGVAGSFAAALGVPKVQGYYQNGGYTITNCIGHLLTLYDAQDYDEKFKRWAAAQLPIVPEEFLHKPAESTAKQLALVKGLLSRKYDKYIIATDAGREGELIARLVLRYCGLADFSNVYRFWTSSALTKDVILSCLGTVKPAGEYDGLYSAGLYRQLSDWLVGINFSRFFTAAFNDRFIFGRVQTPVLNMIVRRETTRKDFKKSFFYRLEIKSLFDGTEFYSYLLNAEGGIDFDGEQSLLPFQAGAAGPSTVTSVTVEKKTLYPPRLFDLTELQKTANSKFGYTSKKTLELAQALYEKYKCLSYPRTASRYLSRVNLSLFVSCLDALEIPHGGISADNKNIFNDEAMEKNKEDHHALILLAKLPDGAAEEERNVYELVRHNMATVVMEPHVFEEIKVLHGTGSMAFIAGGINVIEPGWKSAGPAGADEDEENEEEDGRKKTQALPALKTGGQVTLKDPAVTRHERKPPKSFSEAALLAAMKKYGLGTVATRDTVIEGLVKNGYAFRKGKNLLPADKAFFFIDAVLNIDNAGLRQYLDAANTGEWERMLENEPEAFFSNIKSFVVSTINDLKLKSFASFQNSAGACPLCGGPVIQGKMNYYCSNCKEKNCSFSVGKTICKAAVTEADIKALLAGKKTGLKSMESKAGKEFKAYLSLDKEGSIQFEFKDSKPKGAKK